MPSPMHSGTPLWQSQKKPFSPSCFPCHSSLSVQLMLAVRAIVPSGSAFSFDGKIPLGVQKGPEPDLPLEEDTPVSPNSRKIKRLELHPGESQASPAHPEIPQPGWGRCRFPVRRVRAAVAAHARSRLAGGRRALPAKGPGFQSRRPLVPHTGGDLGRSEDQASGTRRRTDRQPVGSGQEWPARGRGGHGVPSPGPGETEPTPPRTQNQTPPGEGRDSRRAGPASMICSACALESIDNSGDPEACCVTSGPQRTARSAGPPLLRTAGLETDAPQAPAPTSAP